MSECAHTREVMQRIVTNALRGVELEQAGYLMQPGQGRHTADELADAFVEMQSEELIEAAKQEARHMLMCIINSGLATRNAL